VENTPRARQEARKSAQRSGVRRLRGNKAECGEIGVDQAEPVTQASLQTTQNDPQQTNPRLDVLFNDVPDRQHEQAEPRESCVHAAGLKEARRPHLLPLHPS
jgi:hypothetical protein